MFFGIEIEFGAKFLEPKKVRVQATAADLPDRPDDDFTLPEAVHTPAFYIIAIGLFSLSMLVTALHFYQVSILVNQGLPPQVPALPAPQGSKPRGVLEPAE